MESTGSNATVTVKSHEYRLSRVALVVPPIRDFYFTRHRFASLGALIVKSILERNAQSVDYFNFPTMTQKGTKISIPHEISYLEPFLIEHETGRLSYFSTYRHFGPSYDDCAAQVMGTKPDYCFISLFAFAYAEGAIELSTRLKAKRPEIKIILGGAGVSVYPAYFLKNSPVDFVLAQEAEAGLMKLITEFSRDTPQFTTVPNLWFRANGTIHSPLHSAYALENEIEPIIHKSYESSSMLTFSTSLSRGCPKHCNFCSSHLTLGKKFRTVPLYRASKMLSDISIDHASYKKQIVINIEDDNMLASMEYVKRLFQIIKTRFQSAEIIAENGIDYSFLSPEICAWLISNGMKKFNLSLGSLSSQSTAQHTRSLYLDRYELVIDLLAKNALPNITYIICGFKEDNIDSTISNISYLFKKQTLIGLSPFYPVPGISDFSAFSFFDAYAPMVCAGSSCFPWNQSLSTETLITAFRISRYINLTKSLHRTTIEEELIAKIRDTQKLYTLIKNSTGSEQIIEVPHYDELFVRLLLQNLEKP